MIAHRFLNYLLDNKVAYENFSGYVGYQPPLTAIDANKLFDEGLAAEEPGEHRRHPRGLRERQRLPDAVVQGPAALGPRLGGVPQRLMGARWIWSVARAARPRLAGRVLPRRVLRGHRGRASATSPTLYQPVPHWNPLDWNVGYLWQALEGRRPGRAHVGRVPAHAALRRRRGGALAGDRLPGRLLRVAPRRALARAACSCCSSLPFWISYLMRMFAWTNLLATGGYAARRAARAVDRLAVPVAGPARRRRLARRAADRGDHGARLRLRAVPDPAAVRRRWTGSTSG